MSVLLQMTLASDRDIIPVRQNARRIAELAGFDRQDQTRIATAVSEIARNAQVHGGGGRVCFSIESDGQEHAFAIRVSDQGGGMSELAAMGVRANGSSGMGIVSARRLMDMVQIDSGVERGTAITLTKRLPPAAGAPDPRGIVTALAREGVIDPLAAMQDQHEELLATLNELNARQEELNQLNAELHDTNRGVVALYAELNEKAEALRDASEQKTRFLSNMSHEFRTPLNSILALTRLLLDRTDGELETEQEKQVVFIRRSAEGLTALVDDLLDLAKVEAGRIDVRPTECRVEDLFGSLRGVLKPLQVRPDVELVFADAHGLPLLYTDDGKLTQILRNFVSNALKFTETGRVTVSARHDPATDMIVFDVRDTGIGIPPEFHSLIFEEFGQVDNRLQGRIKGTGLGLPLSRRLAELLGGHVALESTPGKGSCFSVAIPRFFGAKPGTEEGRLRVLIVDDEDAFRYVLGQSLADEGHVVSEAADGVDGLRRVRDDRPDLVILDLHMPRLNGLAVLRDLKTDPEVAAIPVIVATASERSPEERMQLGLADAVVSKHDLMQDGRRAEIFGSLQAQMRPKEESRTS